MNQTDDGVMNTEYQKKQEYLLAEIAKDSLPGCAKKFLSKSANKQ
jgi:hypothetical protein